MIRRICQWLFFFAVYKSSSDSELTDQLYNELKPAVEGANYIVKHMHKKNDYNEVRVALRDVRLCSVTCCMNYLGVFDNVETPPPQKYEFISSDTNTILTNYISQRKGHCKISVKSLLMTESRNNKI